MTAHVTASYPGIVLLVGGSSGDVTVMVQRASVSGDQPEAIVVSVRDQGEGIPPEMALRVFRQFWRGKRRGGTGLGLYIVKGLIEAMGGEMTDMRGERSRGLRRLPVHLWVRAPGRARLRLATR